MRRIFFIIVSALAVATFAAAQESGQLPQKVKAEVGRLITHSTLIGVQGSVMGAPVAGAPYSAEETTQFSQTLGDGTRIQRESRVQVYRDGEGRIRRESPTEITITDPIAGASWVLDPKTLTGQKVAVMFAATKFVKNAAAAAVTRVPPLPPRTVSIEMRKDVAALGPFAAGQAISHNAAYQTMEGFVTTSHVAIGSAASEITPLGQQTIEGVLAEGSRSVTIIAAGEIGNDRPIQTVNERWYSPELKTVIQSRRSDPQAGEDVFRLTNIRRGEPSASLFQPPAGYQIRENDFAPREAAR